MNLLFYGILGVALLFRIGAAVIHMPIVHPDEHFQTLEPAASAVLGYGWRTWEWQIGLRSWFIPGLYIPVLGGLKLIGINGGPVSIAACRVLMAVLSVLMLFQMKRLLEVLGFSTRATLTALGAIAISPTCIAWSVTTLSDTWACLLLWLLLPEALIRLRTPSKRNFALAGMFLTLPFLARIQMLIFPAFVGAVLLFSNPRRWRLLIFFTLGALGPVVFQGLLDWATWGNFLHSVMTNVQTNLFKGVASQYGVSPWYDYFPRLTENFGLPTMIGLLVLLVLGFVTSKKKFSPTALLILLSGLVYFGIHCLIPHKETRFLLPLFPAFFLIIAWVIDSVALPTRFARLARRTIPFLWLLLPPLMLLSANSIYSNQHQYMFDLTHLAAKIHQDGGLRKPDACLLLVDHYWIWTRGELMQGHSFRFSEVSARKPLPPQDLMQCNYALVLKSSSSQFLNQARAHWTELASDENHILYKNILW